MERNKWITIFIIIFAAVSISAIVPAAVSNRKNFDTRSDAAEQAIEIQKDISGAPKVVSVDPSTAYAGKEFNYFMKIVDSDTSLEDIKISVVSMPTWMILDQTDKRLYGTPVYDTSDTVKVELLLDDGTNQVPHTFYLLIIDPNE